MPFPATSVHALVHPHPAAGDRAHPPRARGGARRRSPLRRCGWIGGSGVSTGVPPLTAPAAPRGHGTGGTGRRRGRRRAAARALPAAARRPDRGRDRACRGMSRHAAAATVNLAAPLADGEQVLVPSLAPGGGGATVAAGGAARRASPVDLNSATVEQLDALPGIGPVTAQKIVDYRTEHGPFTSIDDLDAIPGFGPSRIENLRGLVIPPDRPARTRSPARPGADPGDRAGESRPAAHGRVVCVRRGGCWSRRGSGAVPPACTARRMSCLPRLVVGKPSPRRPRPQRSASRGREGRAGDRRGHGATDRRPVLDPGPR